MPSQNKNTPIRLNVPASLHFSAGVREFVSEFATFHKLPQQESNRLKLVIDELFMNAVRYGSKKNSTVIVELDCRGDFIHGTVEDFGEGKKQVTVEDLKKIILEQTNNNIIMKTSGRGLAQIVSKWTDKLHIENNTAGGIKLSFEKKIDKTEAKPSLKANNLVTLQTKNGKIKEHLFVFEGEINEYNLEENQKTINTFLQKNQDKSNLVLDFEKLYYCNSTFIGQIADWYNQVSKQGGQLIIRNPNKDILDIIDMVGLTQIIPIQNLTKK